MKTLNALKAALALVALLLPGAALSAETVAETAAARAAKAKGRAMVQAYCTRCHSLDRVANRTGLKDRVYWQRTVDRMRTNGAPVSRIEAREVVDYLTGLEPGERP